MGALARLPELRWSTWRAGLALGYAIGRIGCQVSGDGDYGKASDLPWAMGYPHGTVPTAAGRDRAADPIYETLSMGLLALVLWRLRDPSARASLFGSTSSARGSSASWWSSCAATSTSRSG